MENSDAPIKSIELQLVRVETCGKVKYTEISSTNVDFIAAGFHSVSCVQDVPKVTPETPPRSRTSR